jgi:hypothetical protein
MTNRDRLTNPIAINLSIPEAIPIWEAAIRDDGTQFTMDNERNAISMIQKLHRYRRLMGNCSDAGFTSMDGFIVQRSGATVRVSRKPVFDTSLLRTLNGDPIEPL